MNNGSSMDDAAKQVASATVTATSSSNTSATSSATTTKTTTTQAQDNQRESRRKQLRIEYEQRSEAAVRIYRDKWNALEDNRYNEWHSWLNSHPTASTQEKTAHKDSIFAKFHAQEAALLAEHDKNLESIKKWYASAKASV